ncbi:MAG TPA: DDE-type integrase/transposase/recombinase, partial [Rhabdochlamydiaceae bacterium]
MTKASEKDSILWHRRMGHIHFRKMNFLVKNNLVNGVPNMTFSINDYCIPCKRGKQHKKSHSPKIVNSINTPLELLHMDLFGPINVRSIGGKSYSLVVTDDYSRFSWVYFLGTKDETPDILKYLFLRLENLCRLKIKMIRSDNGTEFKNHNLELFCLKQGISHQFSAPRTPQQNGVAERKNRTLIEAARTMLSDSRLPVTFWAEAVNTACFVLNRVLTVKRQNKTCYELLNNRKPNLQFLEPFGCPCTILITKERVPKFGEKANDGYFLGYSINSPNKRVFNKTTGQIEECYEIECLRYTSPQ